jgi:hypothetical protein
MVYVIRKRHAGVDEGHAMLEMSVPALPGHFP